jgi:integrase
MNALKTDFELRGKASPQNLSNIARVKKDFGDYPALSLTPERAAGFVRGRVQDGYKNATINRWTEALEAAYRLADLPTPKMPRLSEADNVRTGFFSEIELRNVMAALPPDVADFFEFGAITGMRKEEIASLKWDDLDGDLLTLRSEHAKNGHARSIPLTGALGLLIERRHAKRDASGLVFHRAGPEDLRIPENMGESLQVGRMLGAGISRPEAYPRSQSDPCRGAASDSCVD